MSEPWHAAYPPPRNQTPEIVSIKEVLEWFQSGQKPGKDFLLIDLRRHDHAGGTIRGSINLPAQTMYEAIPSLYRIIAGAKIRKVVWYCGSSRGRGPRAAGWFDDHIKQQNDHETKSLVLEGGIKGWVQAGLDFITLVDGYTPEDWRDKE